MQIAMRESIPGLMNAVRMIFSISSYYNTPEQLNHLFAMVSSVFELTIYENKKNMLRTTSVRLNINFQRILEHLLISKAILNI